MALHFLIFFLLFSSSYSQSISTSTPVPPLQWLNLTPKLTGTSKPPPLKDAFISYDQNSRNVLIFGGISQTGFPSPETYLLNLNTLTWSKPNPPPNLQQAPPSRSALGSISGPDFAANSRSAFMLYGGTGSQQEILADAWEFDFQFQFWSQVTLSSGGPGAESGIAGGLDPRTTGPQRINNTFYVVKSGSDSGLWRLNISGTLASNIPDGVRGDWERKSSNNIPTFSNSASTVVGNKVVSMGGCTNVGNSSCAFIASDDVSSLSTIPSCASSRTGAKLVPNLNMASSGFSSQTFLLLGKLDPDWNDDKGLDRGEVAILDINTGTWSRLIPSGDPETSNPVPGPREGAAVSALPGEGGSRSSSDIIVFGGRDVSGNYLDEVWILRAYNGTISPSSPQWAGFGDGKLQSGYQADGSGVIVQYLSQCAAVIGSPTSPGGPSRPTNTTGSTGNPGDGGKSNSFRAFDTSLSHKVLSSVSIILIFPAILLQRSSPPRKSQYTNRHIASTYACGFLLFIAYGLGIAGIATSFTSISDFSTPRVTRRSSPSSSLALKTTHGLAGITLFVILYGLVPALYLLKLSTRFIPRPKIDASEAKTSPRHSEDKSHVGSMSHNSSLLGSPRPRSQSFGPSIVYRPSNDLPDENDAVSMASSGPQRTFEVINRPKRRRTSGGNLPTVLHEAPRAANRSLSEIDWLHRRRSLNAVGELDYAISQAIRTQEYPPTPATTDVLMASGPRDEYQLSTFPSRTEIIIRIILHLSLCGLCVITLTALWSVPSSKVFFALFLAWTFVSYSFFIILAWRGVPPVSILSVVVARLRGKTSPPPPTSPTPEQYHSSSANTPTPLVASPGYPFPASGSGPYIHHNPPHRTAGPDDLSYASPRSVETDYDDDPDEDEDIRQQRIESEMGRREVSIVTVPKRKLWIANPS